MPSRRHDLPDRLARRTSVALDGPRDVDAVVTLMRALQAEGLLGLPLPGQGATTLRWRCLAAVTASDVILGRLVEAHEDAVAIRAELGHTEGPVGPDALLGVWASASGRTGLEATQQGDGWCLDGRLRFCSGASALDGALVTATRHDGLGLFLLPLDAPGVTPLPDTWPAVGMADSASLDVRVKGVRLPASAAVGGAGAYLDRPGFWVGGAGVAAAWVGGARGVLGELVDALGRTDPSPHQLAHLGASTAAIEGAEAALGAAARAIDAAPAADHRPRAFRVRHVAEQTATEVLERSGRATGAAPLCLDREHARRVADLRVYVRQQHAERDLERIGRDVLACPESDQDLRWG